MALEVSVVVTTRRQSSNLAGCLATVLRQEYATAFETLVVERGGCDEQNQAAARRAGVQYFFGEPTTPLAACNAGAREAHGEIVVCLDDDSAPQAGWLDALVAPFATSVVMIVAGRTKRYSGNMDRRPPSAGDLVVAVDGTQDKSQDTVITNFERITSGVNVAFRRHFFEEFGGFDERLESAARPGSFEKSERLFRMIAAGYTLVYAPGAVVLHP